MSDRITIAIWSDGDVSTATVDEVLDEISQEWSNGPEYLIEIDTSLTPIKVVKDHTQEMDDLRQSDQKWEFNNDR